MAKISKSYFSKFDKDYSNGLSIREIGIKYGFSIDEVYYFFRKYDIKRRSYSERNNCFFARKKPSFKIKNELSHSDTELKIGGIALYWGEGSKWKGEKIVDFCNSDPEMIKLFLNFLRKICGIDESKLRIYLYCYSNQEPDKLIEHWSRITGVAKKQFTKPYVRKDFDASRIDKMKFGTIHVRYNDKKLYTLIIDWIKEYKKKFI